MNDPRQQDRRLDELETHIAHQDAAIQDLSDVTMQQWDAIKALNRKIERLEATIETLDDALARPPGEEPPPPHY